VQWTAPNQTGVEVSLPLYQYNTQGQAALIADLNSGTKFRFIVTPGNTTVDASWDGNEYALSNNAPLAPSLTIGLQEGAAIVSSLPSWLTQQSGTADVWNATTKSLTINGPSTIVANPGSDAPNITFGGTGVALTIATGTSPAVNIGSLVVTGTNSVVLTSTGVAHILVDNGVLTTSTGNTLDLGNNLLDLVGGSISSVRSEISSGSIFSSDTTIASSLATFGVINGNALASVVDTATGVTPAATDVIVRHTYYGDANLDGHVDGSDYTKIDPGFTGHLTGWANGDFNYDNVIDGSDYTLIDNAFNTQGTALPTAQFGTQSHGSAIPTTAVASAPTLSDLLNKDKKISAATIVDSIDASAE
jgi:hypothetical protein